LSKPVVVSDAEEKDGKDAADVGGTTWLEVEQLGEASVSSPLVTVVAGDGGDGNDNGGGNSDKQCNENKNKKVIERDLSKFPR